MFIKFYKEIYKGNQYIELNKDNGDIIKTK